MTSDAPALLIANMHSRRGREADALAGLLERRGVKLRREPCPAREELSPLIRSLQEQVSAVIIAGGDGTINGAASALSETGLPLGILPLGTANDLARTLGIPAEGEGAVEVIAGGNIRTLDLGTVNEIPFFNVASMGLSVATTKRLERVLKRRYGVLAYPIAAGAAVLRTGRFRAALRADGEEVLVTTLQIAVGNGRHYGGGMVVNTDAAIDDGFLDVYSLEPRARWRLLFMARAFSAGEHGKLNEVRTLRCRSATITTRRPREVAADGEIVTRTPAHFGLLPRAVRVFAP